MVHFTFGIGRYFSFSFSIGPSICPCTNGNHIQSLSYDGSEGNRDIRRRKRVLLELPALPRFPGESAQYDAAEPVETQVTEVQILPSCHFLTIPSEIRFMIYALLLTSKGSVMDPHKLMGPQKSVLAGTRPQIKDIDATILRTSRLIYHEALQTLYRKNNFQFSSPDAIESFAFGELPRQHVFGMKPGQHGRLTMLSKVYLRLGSSDFPVIRTRGHPIDRETLWRGWRDFFEPATAYMYSLRMGFPALQTLFLDFSDWELDSGKGSELDVKRFVTKLRGDERLRILVMKGVVHKQNLNDFRSLLVKPEGDFLVLDSRHQLIMCSRRGVNLPV